MRKLGSFLVDAIRANQRSSEAFSVSSTGLVVRPESATTTSALKTKLSVALSGESQSAKASQADAEQLAASITAFASGAEFAAAVDAAVQPPIDGETEEQFVQRAKTAIRRIFLEKHR